MIYEMRVYEAAEGHAEAMRRRFEAEVVPRLPRHGIELLGVFTDDAAPGKLTYLSRFESEDARKHAWASFSADEEWRTVKADSEKNGPLIRQQLVTILTPTVVGLLLS
ncbi:NIPSNAP family protein [Pseudorhodoplanes sp.]|uniref:NIPSNAP family protein n=1 Tax=Pseudorhodoplanes sp. TaxID=1934341 RepID=UPI003918B140